jgi:beta-lactam-binding protein with PASTA domain
MMHRGSVRLQPSAAPVARASKHRRGQRWAAPALSALLFAIATGSSASVFYKFNVVAETPTNGFVSFGTGPSVNDKGKVAFVGSHSGGPSIFLWTPIAGVTDIASSLLSTNRSFGDSVRLNSNDEVLSWTRLLPSGNYEVRVFRSATPNDNSVMVRGLSGASNFDLLYQNPAMNNTRALEDRANGLTGNKDGVCDGGETCVSQIAFNAPLLPSRFLGTVIQNPSDAADHGTQHTFSLNTSQSHPMMSDDGRIVVRGVNTTDPILLFNYTLGAPTTIAGSGQGFTALGASPSITPDGKIIAFAGNRGHGDGIFLSIDQSEIAAGQRRLVRIVGENATVQKSELGVDGSNSKLFMQAIELDSRVGIIYTPDADGVANKVLVVSFIGTPNAASRTNPGTGNPFTFSNQKGLWTIRIDLNAALYQNICVVRAPGSGFLPTPKGDDQLVTPAGTPPPPPYIVAGANGVCETENTDTNETLFSRSTPIPVVQIGDTIKSAALHTVSAIAVNDPIAQANYDNALLPRAERVGDHRVAFYVQVDGGATQMIVRGEQLDSDQDGLFDHWETEGIDLDGTGNIDLDLPAMGANPFARDLFWQIDWTADRAVTDGGRHRPAPNVLKQLVQFYAAAPALPNGIPAGINLHVDAGTGKDAVQQFFSRNMGLGPLRGGNTLPGGPVDVLYEGLPGSVSFPGINAVAFDTAKTNVFWNHDRGSREFAFMHIIMADFHHLSGQDGGANNVTPVLGTAFTGGGFAGDAFYIEDNGNPLVTSAHVSNHAIKITAGKGAGQVRGVVSSATDGATGFKLMTISPAWTTLPDDTSQFAILSLSSGLGFATIRNDGAFAPGKNLAITIGLDPAPTGETGTYFDQTQTFTHEVGHLLSLMHGGTDHINYKATYVSVLNYAYQLCQTGFGRGLGGVALAGAAACPVDTYSGVSDAISNNWENVDLRFPVNLRAFGQAFGAGLDPPSSPFPPEPENSLRDRLDAFPPADITAPTVTVAAPTRGATVALASAVPVTFSATDNVGVTNGEVVFDLNGDGAINEATEVFVPTFTPPGSFHITLPAVSGPSGPRKLTAIAYDAVGNAGVVNITINVGTVAPVTVPNVVGLTQAAATDALTTATLDVGTVTKQTSGTVAAGAVISENPAAGQSRPPGTAIDIVVSLGVNGVSVPDVTGLSQAAATTAITNAALVVGIVTQVQTSQGPGVIGQSPAAAAIVASGSAVQLLVAQSVGGATVPNVVGLTQAAATSAITGAGLVVGTISQQTSATVPAGDVISQSPVGGSSVAAGSAVDLVISTGTTAPAPVFVSAVSRKVHGAAGTFNLPLSLVATAPTTEPRTGPAQTIVFTFDKAPSGVVLNVTEGTATAAPATFSGNDVIIALTGVTNQQYVTVALTNVSSADGGTGGSASVRVGFLLGDVNQNRVISVADVGLVNQQLAQTVTAANYLKDVNASGTLTVGDKGITNANLTRALPAP